MDVLRFAVLGVGAGAVYALAAQGIVLVYRGSGVLNFASGAMGMVSAFVFYDLRSAWNWPTPIAFAAAVALAMLIGALTQLLVMRPLRNASGLARLIATLGVMTLLQAVGIAIWGDTFRISPSILPDRAVTLPGDIRIGLDRLLLLAIAIVLTLALMLVYRYTRFGLATSAVAENRRATAALGHSPNMIATINWALGAGLAGFAAVLIVPLTSLQVNELTLLVIPALAAALVGGFTSFPLTLVGGLAIGIAESEFARYVHTPGWAKSVPFLVIITVLVVRGRALPLRGEGTEKPPELGTGRVSVTLVVSASVTAALVIWFWMNASWLDATITTLSVAVVLLSLVVVTGFTGQVSLAQFALAGMGAWAAARLIVNYDTPVVLAIGAGVLAAIPIGVLVGLPALRTRGVNLAVATLGLALIIQQMVLGNASRTGGALGTTIGDVRVFGIDISTVRHADRYALFVLVVFVLCALAVANLRRGRAGRRLIAVRSNERAATALGIGVFGAKLYAFGLSAAIAALGGILIAFRNPTIVFSRFGIFESISAVLLAVIGGVGYVLGSLFGAVFAPGAVGAELIEGWFTNIDQIVKIVSGVLLLVVLMRDPNGLVSLNLRDARAVLRRCGERGRRLARWAPQSRSTPEVVTTPRGPVEPAVLEVQHLSVRFGTVTAVDDVSLRVEPGTIVGLVGPNGAGKTTLIDAVTGFVHPTGGHILLDDEPIDSWSGARRCRAGLGRSFQSLELFESMTVRENLQTASDDRDPLAYVTDLVHPGRRPLNAAAANAVREFELGEDLDRRPDELPYGKRRLVAIARAAATGPSVLLLDEPAAGLDETATEELGRLLRRLADDLGMGILLVEHDVPFVFRVCDRIAVLDFGRKIAEGPPAEVRDDPAVAIAYLGEDTTGEMTAAKPTPAVPARQHRSAVVEARGVSAGYGGVPAVLDVDLFVRPGEVVALLGPNGAGKTTLLHTLAGELSPSAGEVLWKGNATTSPLHERARQGLALVTEERSVFMGLSTGANLALGRGDPDEALALFPELAPLLGRRAGLLSGGEQQILALARALAAHPELLLADELSLGLAPIVVSRLLRAVRNAADQGAGVLLVEQHVHRALEIADRGYVISRGRIVLTGTAGELRDRLGDIRTSYLAGLSEGVSP